LQEHSVADAMQRHEHEMQTKHPEVLVLQAKLLAADRVASGLRCAGAELEAQLAAAVQEKEQTRAEVQGRVAELEAQLEREKQQIELVKTNQCRDTTAVGTFEAVQSRNAWQPLEHVAAGAVSHTLFQLAQLPGFTWAAVAVAVSCVLLVDGSCWQHCAAAFACYNLLVLTVAAANMTVAAYRPVAAERIILVCGGEPCRDELGAKLAVEIAADLVFFSSGHYKSVNDFDSSSRSNQHRFRFGATVSGSGVERPNLDLASTMLLDRQAIDTVANFTSLVDAVRPRLQGGVGVVVVTCKYHRRRAAIIASIVLASQGLSFRMVNAAPTPAGHTEHQLRSERQLIQQRASTETSFRCARDAVRSIFWLLYGCTGDGLAAFAHKDRAEFRARAMHQRPN